MTDEKQKQAIRNSFTDYLMANGLRRTAERYEILEAFISASSHLTLAQLSAGFSSSAFRISRATLYNTLELLVRAGLIRCHRFEDRPTEYECVVPGQQHVHLVCGVCGTVREVRDATLTAQLAQRRFTGFHPDHFEVTVYGTCSRCLRRRRRAASAK